MSHCKICGTKTRKDSGYYCLKCNETRYYTELFKDKNYEERKNYLEYEAYNRGNSLEDHITWEKWNEDYP